MKGVWRELRRTWGVLRRAARWFRKTLWRALTFQLCPECGHDKGEHGYKIGCFGLPGELRDNAGPGFGCDVNCKRWW